MFKGLALIYGNYSGFAKYREEETLDLYVRSFRVTIKYINR